MKVIKNLLFGNIFIKVLALSLAIITYLYVHSEDVNDKILTNIAIHVKGMPQDWRVVKMSNTHMDLKIEGPREKVELRSKDNVNIWLDMSDIDFTEREDNFEKEFVLSKEAVRGLDYDIDLLFEKPQAPRILIEVARFSTRKLNVQLNISGQPAPDYEERWRKYSPTIVDVTGPENVIKYIDSIPTVPIIINGRKDNYEAAGVGLDTAFLKAEKGVVFECDSRIQVSIGIKPKPSEKKLTGIPVRVINRQDKGLVVKTKPAVIDVTVSGDLEELQKIQKSLVHAYVDADDLPNSPGAGVRIGVKFFLVGEWDTIRVMDKISVSADISLQK